MRWNTADKSCNWKDSNCFDVEPVFDTVNFSEDHTVCIISPMADAVCSCEGHEQANFYTAPAFKHGFTDRLLFPQILLSVFSSLGGAASLLLLLVPVGRVTVKYPERVIFDVGCSMEQDRILHLGMGADPPCTFVPSLNQGRIQQVQKNGRELHVIFRTSINAHTCTYRDYHRYIYMSYIGYGNVHTWPV
jgi:hypothetical protein